MSLEFIARLRDEQKELTERRAKLLQFMNTPTFLNLPKQHQTLLRIQAGVMHQYQTILQARLDLLTDKQPDLPTDEPIVIEQNTFDIDRDGLPDYSGSRASPGSLNEPLLGPCLIPGQGPFFYPLPA